MQWSDFVILTKNLFVNKNMKRTLQFKNKIKRDACSIRENSV